MYISVFEKIREFNKQFNINTKFIEMDVKGYSFGNTIYLNKNMLDIEKNNLHELLHFFTNNSTFKMIKTSLKIDENLRKEYKEVYMKLYEDDNSDIIGDEITIDYLVNNYVLKFKNGLVVGDYYLGNKEQIKDKRYLSLNMKSSIKDMNLTEWEKIFVINYYDAPEHLMPNGKEKYVKIKKDIEKSLINLYALAENKDAFIVEPHSLEVIRDYNNELNILIGEGKDTTYYIENKESILKDSASKLSIQLYEEYKHLINNIKECSYEDAFKVMMLYETLTKVYRFEVKKGKRTTLVSKRKMCESIKSHMIFNNITLNIIYNNVCKYNRFADLYFDALEVYNNKIVEKANIKIDNVETYGKGKWIKFEEKNSNPEEYLKNVQRLASLVKDTQWCTKYLSSTMLSEGDLYVFVDNDNKPHLAVKLSGNEIDEVRGIENGSSQEIEADYRDVAISFLKNNESIKYGLEWLEKEEWNKRLINYNKLIKNNLFTYEMMNSLNEDLFDYSKCKFTSSHKEELLKNLPLIIDKIATYFNCTIDEICLGDAIFENMDYDTCPYKIILGDANFSFSNIIDTGKLQIVGGNIETYECPLQEFSNLEVILKNADLSYSNINNLGKLKIIGGDLDINECPLVTLSNLEIIGGNAYLSNPNLCDLGNLNVIMKDAYFGNSSIESTNNLKTIFGNVIFNRKISFDSLEEVLGSIICENVTYESLDKLKEKNKIKKIN